MTAGKLTRRKIGAGAFALVDGDGVEHGRYGGRTGDRWAQVTRLDGDGDVEVVEDVTDGSAISVGTLVGLLTSAIERHAEDEA